MRARCYHLQFQNTDRIPDANAVAEEGIRQVLDRAFGDCTDNDLVGVSINHPALDTEILIPFDSKDRMTTAKVMELIENVQQSKRELDFDSDIVIQATIITPPNGQGYIKMTKGRVEVNVPKHPEIFTPIKNNDWLCFARSVVTAKARAQYSQFGDTSVKWRQIQKGDRYTLQKNLAVELMLKADLLTHTKKTCGIPEYKKIQKVLVEEGFQLKVFSHDHFNACVFDESVAECHPLYIFHHDNHYK